MYERDPALDIRRPELRGVRRRGTVRWLKDDKGCGRITADNSEILWVHHTGIDGVGDRSLAPGERVSFVWEGSFVSHRRHVGVGVRRDR